jgi:ParB family chromosome partitioning protein
MKISAKITAHKDLPLDQLTISKGQVRTSGVSEGIDELAKSIAEVGLLHPIVVCPAEKKGKYEILIGQRRFLAHRMLKRKTIPAAIFNKRVDEITAKVYSLTENLLRKQLNSKDMIDACTFLFRKYDSIKAVADETGLPYNAVREYVKFDRLHPKLQQLVDKGEVPLKTVLRAQDAASAAKTFNAAEAVKLAKEMSPMSGAQQKKIVKEREEKPDTSADEVIERAKTGGKVTQILVTLGAEAHRSLQDYAKDEGTPMDDAARGLIEEGLTTKGFLKE